MKKQDIIKQIQKTIKQLSGDLKEADTIKALQKQIESMQPCKYGKIGKKVNGCSSCGYWVECSNTNIVANRVKQDVCKTCKHFETDNLTKL